MDAQTVGIAGAATGSLAALASTIFASRFWGHRFEADRAKTADRLREAIHTQGDTLGTHEINSDDGPTVRHYYRLDATSGRSIEDDQFAAVLIEYYAYGLTQAKRSFFTSQLFSALGALVLLSGVGLAILRAETSGDLYASAVTSCSGVVATIIGQFFHRRADVALQHMAKQTDSLREDMRAERSAEQAILLLAEVEDPEVKARLQAGLIMRLSGSEMPSLHEPLPLPGARRSFEQSEAPAE